MRPPPPEPPPGVTWQETEARSITRVHGICDPWFLGRWGMNLYRGCQHGCLYCDGRAEKYHVQGDFTRNISIKRNALSLLRQELERRKEPGFVFLGGGVTDAYQPVEARYGLARGVLELVLELGLPVHVLTKSVLVERDLDLLQSIHERARAVLSFSIQTTDEDVRVRFEPGAAPLEERWRLLREARRRGLGTSLMAMPVLPGISDQPQAIDALVAQAAACGVDFLPFSGLTLRPGIQKDTCLEAVETHYPQLLEGYERLFSRALRSGSAEGRYYQRVNGRFAAALERHGLSARMPQRLFTGLVPQYTEVAVLLEHRELALRLAGQAHPPLAKAGWAIQRWAHGALGRRGRRRGFDYRQLEHEFREDVQSGRICELQGVQLSTLPAIRALAEALPRPGGARQLGLF